MCRQVGRGLLCPFPWGELGPHLTQCRLGWGLPPYQVVSWSIQPFGHGPKSGRLLCLFLWGELGPHLTQCGQGRGLGWGLLSYQVASWSIQPFGQNTPMLQTDREIGQTGQQPRSVAWGKPLWVRTITRNGSPKNWARQIPLKMLTRLSEWGQDYIKQSACRPYRRHT